MIDTASGPGDDDDRKWSTEVAIYNLLFVIDILASMSMSGQYLNTITENASRLGMRLQESFSEHTRDLNISRATGSNYLEGDEKVKNIRRQLDSSSDREKLDAMKRLVAVCSLGNVLFSVGPTLVS